MRAVLSALVVCTLVALGAEGAAAESKLPPPPTSYFNDYAGLVSAQDAARLDAKLREFQAQTSNQILVAVFPTLPSPSLEDFTVRTAESWKAGRSELDNGAVLFLFVQERKLRIETGYGLEGALPDALARRILDEQVVPRFRAGDWAGGLEAGVDAMMAATRGEYEPPPRKASRGASPMALVVILLFVLLFFWLAAHSGRGSIGRTYDRRGYRRGGGHWGGTWGGGGWSSGGGWGGGGGGFGGGGFSGGGGSFGGGGASSSW